MIAIVTDSTAPITRQEAKELGVFVVPHSYLIDGTMYLENYADANLGYAQRLRATGGHGVTAQTTAAAYAAVFRQLLAQNYEVLCLVISSRLSGAWTSAATAARETGSAHIAVVDSRVTAGALYYQILRTRQLTDEGLSLQELADCCRHFDKEIGVAFSVSDMSALRRSHRLGLMSQSVNTILDRRPVFRLQNGAIVSRSLARGRGERVRMLAAQVPSGATDVMVQGMGTTQEVNSLIRILQHRFPKLTVQHREVGPVLSIHIGMEALVVSWRSV